MHRKVAAALVAALALAVAGCGGSEETLTRAQLVRRIETACREGQRAAGKQMRGSRGSNERVAFIQAILAGQKAELDAIGDVNGPDAVNPDFEAFKDAVQERIDVIERVASVDRADVESALRAAQSQAEAAARRIEAAARRLGVEGCS